MRNFLPPSCSNGPRQVSAVSSTPSSTMEDPYLGTARADPELHTHAEMMSRRARRESFLENLRNCCCFFCLNFCQLEMRGICSAACWSCLVNHCCLCCVGSQSCGALLLRAMRDACWLPLHVFWQQGCCACCHGLTWAKVGTAVGGGGGKWRFDEEFLLGSLFTLLYWLRDDIIADVLGYVYQQSQSILFDVGVVLYISL